MAAKTVLLGISGPSSSGKTTLARLLRSILPSSFILHEDDFYVSDTDIPIHDDIQDWDCLEALDLTAMESALQHIKTHGELPPSLNSKEDQNSVGEVRVSSPLVAQLRTNASSDFQGVKVAIMDGFLLYAESMPQIRSLFDVRLFLPVDHDTMKQRRQARKGYVTLEGFWEDPPGYVDRIVWPNYVTDHKFLFQNSNVEADVDQAVVDQLDLNIMPKDGAANMDVCLEWAYKILADAVKKRQEA